MARWTALAFVASLAFGFSGVSGLEAESLRAHGLRALLGSTQFTRNYTSMPKHMQHGMGPIRAYPGAPQPLTPEEVAAIPKYALSLALPGAMPKAKENPAQHGPHRVHWEPLHWEPQKIDYYEISMIQTKQQVLPGCNLTTVFAYAANGKEAETASWPSLTIEARHGRPVRVKWINKLVDGNKNFIPPFLPIDQTLHWANPGGGDAHRDDSPCMDVCMYDAPTNMYSCSGPVSTACKNAIKERYTGPLPTVVHLHGHEDVGDESDGHTEAWFTPAAANIPRGYATEGSWYQTFKHKAKKRFGVEWEPGSATYQYPNSQRATNLWYHDHTLGVTRVNVYAGLVGLYYIRGGEEKVLACPDVCNIDPASCCTGPATLPGPPPTANVPARDVFELPLAIQDRSFSPDGELFYPVNDMNLLTWNNGIDTVPVTLPSGPEQPFWVPEFYGDVMIVNGRAWPTHDVRPNLYRLRILNGCDARFLNLTFSEALDGSNPLPFHIIGNEAGFYDRNPITATSVFLSPSERYDILFDFNGLGAGTFVFLLNAGPDGAWDGSPGYTTANPDTVGQVMRFVVQEGDPGPTFTKPENILLPKLKYNAPVPTAGNRTLAQMELPAPTTTTGQANPTAVLLGQVDKTGVNGPVGIPQFWSGPVTENPAVGGSEYWEFWGFGPDAHPIHVHERYFEVVSIKTMDTMEEVPLPETYKNCLKDTVLAPAYHITTIKLNFPAGSKPGVFMWHCHIIEHEDNEMMRPFCLGQPGYKDPKNPSSLFCPGPNPPSP